VNRDVERELISKDKLLGKVPDTDERWPRLYRGVSASFVGSVRKGLGIPPAPYKKHKPKRHPSRPAIAVDELLGKVPDRALAKKHKCSRHLISDVRRELGIGPARQPSLKNPTPVMLTWQTIMIDNWKRPKGIDQHLESLRD
jgi:hypothetical protein